jgi:cytochrome P450
VRDTTVAGVPVAAGAHVTTLLAAANRDPEVFSRPQRFDVTRENAREHLAFSGGRHFCVGAALARVEGEIGLQSLFERFPRMTAADGAQRRPTRVLRGWEHLPVVPVPAQVVRAARRTSSST